MGVGMLGLGLLELHFQPMACKVSGKRCLSRSSAKSIRIRPLSVRSGDLLECFCM